MPVARAKATINRPTWDDVNADPSILFDPDDALSIDTTRSWVDPSGYRLSDRIWRAESYDRTALDTELYAGLALGLGPEQVAKNIEGYMTPAGQAMRTRSPRAGMGSYAARRLARTETTRAFGDALKKSAALNPFVKGIKWLLSGSHDDIDICDEHAQRSSDGKQWGPGEYALDDVPPYPSHPNELCTLATVDIDQREIDRAVNRINNPIFPIMTDDEYAQAKLDSEAAGKTLFGERSEAAFDPATMSAMGPNYPPPFTPTDDPAAAEAYAKSLGIKFPNYEPPTEERIANSHTSPDAGAIKADVWHDRLLAASTKAMNVMNEGFYRMAQYRFPMPKGAVVTVDEDHANAIAYHDSFGDTIFANVFDQTWHDLPQPMGNMEEQVKDMHDKGWLVSTEPTDLIVHEFGHHLHIGDGSDKQVMALGRHLPTAEEDATMASVSHYAQTSPYEYVAEVFTKLIKGQDVTPEQMDLYKEWHGPSVPEKKP